MLIDPLTTQFSSVNNSNTLATPSMGKFIEMFKTNLISSGWSQSDNYYATAALVFPLGLPASSGPPSSGPDPIFCSGNEFGVGGFVTVSQLGASSVINFNYYDPYHDSPSAGGCLWFALGLSAADTANNLAIEITAATPFNAVVTNVGLSYTITMTAKTPGGLYNLYIFFGDGRWVAGSVVSNGGGYGFDSVLGPTTNYFHVDITGDYDYVTDGGDIDFVFSVSGISSTSYSLTSGDYGGGGDHVVAQPSIYTVASDPYGFVIYDSTDDTLDSVFRHTSLFAAALTAPSGTPERWNTPAKRPVLVIGPNQRTKLAKFNNGTMFFDTAWLEFGDLDFAQFYGFKSPYNASLLTPDGVPLVIAPYIDVYNGGTMTPIYMTGTLWDCALTTDFIATGGLVMISDKTYLPFAWSGNAGDTVATFLVVVPTPPTPPLASGHVNVFGYDCALVDGTTNSGAPFTFSSSDVGKSITIDGTQYYIATYVSSTDVFLTTPIKTLPLTDVSFTMP